MYASYISFKFYNIICIISIVLYIDQFMRRIFLGESQVPARTGQLFNSTDHF